MDGVVIRPAAARDIDAMAHLWEQLVLFHRNLDDELPTAAPNGALQYGRRLIDQLDNPYSRVLIAENGSGQVIGYVLGVIIDLAPEMFTQERSGFLADIFVDEAHRRRGVGRALVEKLAAWFRDRDLPYFEWYVAAQNPESIAFWRSLGGRELMLRMRAPLERKSS